VTKTYEGGGPDVLRGVDLRVRAGEALAIVGPSGCGKSTLLNIIGALDRPTSGQVVFEGRDVATAGDAQLAQLRGERIGFVFQAHHLLPQCTVLENVLVPTLVGPQRPDAASRAHRLLERVGLAHRLTHRPGQLSGGERQRAAVVRALINQPALLLADEPTGSLDRAGSEALGQLLMDLNREEGVTLVVVTHSPQLSGRMRRTYELRDGRLARL
jgi:ABC-type lipoprotein export system ATPase subunit